MIQDNIPKLTSMSEITSLPTAVVEELENAGISEDSLIFYQRNRWVFQRGPASFNDNQPWNHPIESLGPFDIHAVDISFELFPNTFEYSILKIGNRVLKEEETATGIFAPIARITLEGFARDVANIPENATHFCWLYQPNNIRMDDNIKVASSHELNLLKLGGFAYFIADQNDMDTLQLVRVNSLSESAENGLIFEEPVRWKPEFTKQLWDQKRFHPVTLPYLRSKGAQYFAFINPYESFYHEGHPEPWTPSPNGAFVYLFNEDHSPHRFDCYCSVADNCLGAAPSDEKQ